MEDKKQTNVTGGQTADAHQEIRHPGADPGPGLLESDCIARYTAKDSVFCDLFRNKKYLLQLYQTLHPEDTETTEDDLTDITIRNVLTDGIYNDLGFRNKDRVVILTEAQSSWSMNILIRMLFYMSETYHDYFMRKNVDLYSRTKVRMPSAELYVVFTGERVHRPEYISLSGEFFGGKACDVEVRAKVLYGDEGNDIISQYVTFSKVYTAQVKRHGYSRMAVLETIRICRDRDVLTEYLKTRESEVVSIMKMLFDDEYIQRAYHMRVEKEAKEAAEKEVRAAVEKEIRAEAEKEVRAAAEKEIRAAVEEKAIREMMENASKMVKAKRIKMDEVREFFPQLSPEDIETLRQMVEG